MKRSHALRELSREHHEALVLARHACAVEPGSEAAQAWGDAMRAHVQFEERTLFPLAKSVLDLTVLGDLMTR
ncbi:MAG: hypothetical protein ACYCZ6_05225 [Polaromonas sp.]